MIEVSSGAAVKGGQNNNMLEVFVFLTALLWKW